MDLELSRERTTRYTTPPKPYEYRVSSTNTCTLPSPPVPYNIPQYYFTSIPLFSELRACKFGVVGTTRPHKEFPNQLVESKNRFATKLEWNTLLAVVVQDILCLAWQDNNIVLALSNIHTVNRAEDFREKQRRRPAKTSTNRRIVRKVFGDNYIKELQIPCFINDYNYYIGGVDLANQFRESYETHRATLRNWWPLFY